MTEYTTGQFFATDNLAAISNLNGGRSEQNRSTGNGAKNYQKHLSKNARAGIKYHPIAKIALV
jgi:hypothetical protein